MMKTKIVYVVVSLDSDIYMEQAIVSAWSARYYNPDCQIEMVCCQDTFKTLDSGIRARYKSLFNKIHIREFKPEQGMMERSRWMKTTLREIIEGDFLYLDSDTVVCADLSCVDGFNFDLGMVLDQNSEFDEFLYRDVVIARTKRLFDVDISNESRYFNSGVAFVKDCDSTREFYRSWHSFWKFGISKRDGLKDQAALSISNLKHDHLITEISGNFNCQVMTSIQYLHTAKVMHYFNTLPAMPQGLNPFYGKKLFEYVKCNGVTEEIQHKILNNKSLFSSPSMPVPREGALLWKKSLLSGTFENKIKSSNSYYAISFIWQRFPKIMHIIEYAIGLLIRLFQLRKKM